MKSYLTKDYNFGIANELNHFQTFKKYFNDENLIQSKSKTALFDYESDKNCIELKTRRFVRNEYEDTMIGINKINFCDEKDKDFYFCFSFTDGLFFWKYDKNDLDKLRYDIGGRRDRGRVEINDYAYIPIEMLTKIE